MNLRSFGYALILSVLAFAGEGCWNAPGKPSPGAVVGRPDQVVDFDSLYSQNCAACHGDHGHYGAAISLANPVYLATVSLADLQHTTSMGVPGTLMPGFSKSAGGVLTDRQISVIVQGIINAWSRPAMLNGQSPPPYAKHLVGDLQRGERAFQSYCARCHSADAMGVTANTVPVHTGSLVDPAYLSLISEQSLRTSIIAGKPDQGMPDWRSIAKGTPPLPLNDQEITDIVAWLSSHRTDAPGQPYRQ